MPLMREMQGHQVLYRNLQRLHDELAEIERDVKGNEQHFFTQIKKLSQLLEKQKKSARGEDPLRQFYASTLAHISTIVGDWIARIDQYELHTSFRKHYGDSLLVYVYGKVKAGKSSLGNFMAYGREKPSPEWREALRAVGHEPHFFVAEKGENSIEDTTHRNGFYVDSAEATSCIQGFTLPGLTWIDSPGIHSVTEENHELARKYVESADLIIYPMNSAQPGRRTDMDEIRELIQRRKRVLLLITRSDENEEDEDDDGNIISVYQMKSAEKRRQQEAFVAGEFSALCQNMNITDVDYEVQTVSVRYATSQHNTPQALTESGMQAFIDKLNGTINSEGLALKKQVPYNALQAFYRFLLDDSAGGNNIHALKESLTTLSGRVGDHQSEFERRCEALKVMISNDIALKIDALVDAFAEHQNAKKLERGIVSAVSKQLNDRLIPLLNEMAESLAVDINSITRALNLSSHIRLEPVHQTIDIDTTGRNAAIGGGIGAAVVGGIAGFFSGGLAAVAGSAVGGAIGRFIGKQITSSRQVTFRVGDNRLALIQKLSEMTDETIVSAIDRARFDVDRQLLNPVRQTVTELADQVEAIRCWAEKNRQKEGADVF